jgi:DNA-3-methyladenine glycosylase
VNSSRSLSNPDFPSFLNHPDKLKREFYTRPLITVAKELLGKILVKTENVPAPSQLTTSNSLITSDVLQAITLNAPKQQTSPAFLAGKIVEVEAYNGSVDQAAHTFIGKTKRNEIMFHQGGYLYVYFTYGVHFCANVVTGKEGQGTAVLIRAIQPLIGIDVMITNRYGRDLKNEKEKLNLTNGPGKICQALRINQDHYGADLTGNEILIIDQPKVDNKNIIVTKRIGISKSVDLPWRFYIKDNPWVSAK